jgi:hypothetical protein
LSQLLGCLAFGSLRAETKNAMPSPLSQPVQDADNDFVRYLAQQHAISRESALTLLGEWLLSYRSPHPKVRIEIRGEDAGR